MEQDQVSLPDGRGFKSCPRYLRDRHSVPRDVGRSFPGPACGPFEDGAKVAAERGVHLAAFLAGGEHDALDQLSDGARRLVAVARARQRLGEPLDLAAADDGDVGVSGTSARRSVISCRRASSSWSLSDMPRT